jgi:hypothetical protein
VAVPDVGLGSGSRPQRNAVQQAREDGLFGIRPCVMMTLREFRARINNEVCLCRECVEKAEDVVRSGIPAALPLKDVSLPPVEQLARLRDVRAFREDYPQTEWIKAVDETMARAGGSVSLVEQAAQLAWDTLPHSEMVKKAALFRSPTIEFVKCGTATDGGVNTDQWGSAKSWSVEYPLVATSELRWFALCPAKRGDFASMARIVGLGTYEAFNLAVPVLLGSTSPRISMSYDHPKYTYWPSGRFRVEEAAIEAGLAFLGIHAG